MIPFTKMHGIGNDFVILDGFERDFSAMDLPQLSIAVSDRAFGIGADGLIIAERGSSRPFRMRMFNPDGSESEMCGNGIRCLARFLKVRGHMADVNEAEVETGAGILRVSIGSDDQVRVDMGKARLTRGEMGMQGSASDTFIDQEIGGYRGTAVSMGNPHLVIFLEEAEDVDLRKEGPRLEVHPLFPNRTNVHFSKLVESDVLLQRTWERGAGATLACGTGACAVAVAAHLNGLAGRQVTVKLPGGDLRVDYAETGNVYMTGPAEFVFEGVWPA